MEVKITALNHDDLVNIFSTALYGCSFLEAYYDKKFYDAIPVKNGDCYEDKLADVVLAGGKVEIIDLWAEGSTYGDKGELNEDDVATYMIGYDDIHSACNTEDGRELAFELLLREEGDYFTANNLLQIAVFGEIIY